MSKCASLRRRGRSCLTEARRAQWSLVCVKGTGCTRMRAGYSCRAAEVTNVRGACNATVGRSPTSSLAQPVTTAKVHACVRLKLSARRLSHTEGTSARYRCLLSILYKRFLSSRFQTL